jgi:hypothetical protein
VGDIAKLSQVSVHIIIAAAKVKFIKELILAIMSNYGKERKVVETTSHIIADYPSINAIPNVSQITGVRCSFLIEITAGLFQILVLRPINDGKMFITEVKITVVHANGIINAQCKK